MRAAHGMSRRLRFVAVAVLATASVPRPGAAGTPRDPAVVCTYAKLNATATKANRLLICQAKAAAKGVNVDQTCLTNARNKFTVDFARAESKGGCATTGDAAMIEDQVDSFMADTVTALRPNLPLSNCTALKLKAVGAKARALLRAQANEQKKPDAGKLLGAVANAEAVFTRVFAVA